jgi:Ca2+-binding EF-hand superfamily protein
MRTRLCVVIGLAILLLGPMQGWTQFPGGGGGGRGGGRGGGFNMDPGARFDQMTNGKGVWVRSEITDQRQQFFFDRMADSLKITNGQITRDQYVTYMQQMMANWGGGRRGGGQTPTTPATPGAPTSPGDTRQRDRGGNSDRANTWAETMFRQLDQNQDGYLNSDEMPEALRTELDKWDTDKNGLIDLNEFKAYFQARIQQFVADRNAAGGGWWGGGWGGGDSGQPEPPEEERKVPIVYRMDNLPKELPAWFTQYDSNRDAQISLAEWRANGRSIDEFRKIDRNDDGFLTVDEVLRYEKLSGSGNGTAVAGMPSPGQGGGFGQGGFGGRGGFGGGRGGGQGGGGRQWFNGGQGGGRQGNGQSGDGRQSRRQRNGGSNG